METENQECEHEWMYKILHDHTAANVCTKCGKIEIQDEDPRDNPLTEDDDWVHDVDMGAR